MRRMSLRSIRQYLPNEEMPSRPLLALEAAFNLAPCILSSLLKESKKKKKEKRGVINDCRSYRRASVSDVKACKTEEKQRFIVLIRQLS